MLLICKHIFDLIRHRGRKNSNPYHLLALREERNDGQKIMDGVNDAKLKDLVADLNTTDWRLILHTKNTDAWLNVWGTTLTGTLLAAIEFWYFYVHVMMLPPLKLIENTTAATHHLLYVTDLSAAKEASSSHDKTKCVPNSYNSLNKPYPSHCVRDKPLICQGCSISERDVRQGSGRLDKRGDVLIRSLW